MRILITGASGFLGQFLIRELLKDESNHLVLTDAVPVVVPAGVDTTRIETMQADLCEEAEKVVLRARDGDGDGGEKGGNAGKLDAAYIFHGIMSAGSEANFDLGMRVNIDSTRQLLEALRHHSPGIRVIYASSLAVYGQPLPKVVTEAVVATPEGTYGAGKLVMETLVNEYTRRGFIDGFSLRFPTVTVRPGKPSNAASSFISGIIREPLNGRECVVPLCDRAFPSWVCSPRTLINNLVHVLTLPGNALPPHKRVINAPGIQVTVQEMLDVLAKVAGPEALKLVREEHDPVLARILYSWADNYDNTLAFSLGMKPDPSFEQAVREYQESLNEG